MLPLVVRVGVEQRIGELYVFCAHIAGYAVIASVQPAAAGLLGDIYRFTLGYGGKGTGGAAGAGVDIGLACGGIGLGGAYVVRVAGEIHGLDIAQLARGGAYLAPFGAYL